MSFCILRTAKLPTIQNVAGSASHNFRERQTDNADPRRTGLNQTLGKQDKDSVLAAVRERLASVAKVRKNGVIAIEYFVGASPEWFTEHTEAEREKYFDDAIAWLIKRHGVDNVISVTRQYDETSPHLCAYVVPIDPKGDLSASHFLGGRAKLAGMQTEFAERVGKPSGLERGIEGSTAKHVSIKQYYKNVNTPFMTIKTKVPEVAPPTSLQRAVELVGRPTEHSRAQDRRAAAVKKRNAEIDAAHQVEHAKAAQHDLMARQNAAMKRDLTTLRATSAQLREMPLATVLERLGAIPDATDRHNWKTAVGRITTTPEGKFYAHDAGAGGGGAIDLTMLLEGVNYKAAVGLLGREFGTDAVLSEVLAETKAKVEAAVAVPVQPFALPAKIDQHWPKIREYLVDTRGLDANLIDEYHSNGMIYADRYRNAVFVLGQGEGAELRGTSDKPFHGVRGQKLTFDLAELDGDQRTAFVESSVEALSLRSLGFAGRIIATAGNSTKLMRVLAFRERADGRQIVAGQNNDAAGQVQAGTLGSGATRLTPKGKDWNDDLRRGRAAQSKPAAPTQQPVQQPADQECDGYAPRAR